jgi:hypothetical protein
VLLLLLSMLIANELQNKKMLPNLASAKTTINFTKYETDYQVSTSSHNVITSCTTVQCVQTALSIVRAVIVLA